MNKYQTAKIDSLKLIVKESGTNPESVAKVPKFGSIVNRLDEICNQIEPHRIEQEKKSNRHNYRKGRYLRKSDRLHHRNFRSRVFIRARNKRQCFDGKSKLQTDTN